MSEDHKQLAKLLYKVFIIVYSLILKKNTKRKLYNLWLIVDEWLEPKINCKKQTRQLIWTIVYRSGSGMELPGTFQQLMAEKFEVLWSATLLYVSTEITSKFQGNKILEKKWSVMKIKLYSQIHLFLIRNWSKHEIQW